MKVETRIALVVAVLLVTGTMKPLSAAESPPPTDAKSPAAQSHVIVGPRSDPSTPRVLIYPPIAIWGSQEGSPLVELLIGTDGWVQDARIVVSSGYIQLDAAALLTVGYWHYLPATRDGVPFAATRQVQLRFALTGISLGTRWQNRPPPPVSQSSDDALVPATDTTHFLLYPQMARHRALQGDVTLNILVRSEGNISDVLMTRSSGSAQLDSAALVSVGYWQYDPAIQAGRAVDAWKIVRVHFAPKDSEPESPADRFTPALPAIPGGNDNGTSILTPAAPSPTTR